MNSKEAIERIRTVLGLSSQNFSSYEIKEGGEFKVEGEIEAGKVIYIVTEQGEVPSPDGEFELEDGTKVKVKDSMVESIEKVEEIEAEEEVVVEEEVKEVEAGEHDKEEEELSEEEKEETKLAEATLVDGTIVVNDEESFEIGQKLYVVTEDGRVEAPEGEHETTEGIIVVVDAEGIITEIKEKEEIEESDIAEEEVVEVEVEMSEVIETFTKALESINVQLDELRKDNEELRTKFSKFSKEPAGKPVMDRKGFAEELKANKASKLTKLAELRRTLNK